MQASLRSIESDDLDEISDWEAANGIRSTRRQLSRGKGQFEAGVLTTPDMCVWRWRESQTISSEFWIPEDCVEFCFADYPSSPIWGGSEIARTSMVIHSGSNDYETVLPAGGVAYGVALNRHSLLYEGFLDQWESETSKESARLTQAYTINKSDFRRLARVIDTSFTNSDQADFDLFQNRILAQCRLLVSRRFSRLHKGSSTTKLELVTSARRLIRDRFSTISLDELVYELQVSRRQLELAFRKHLSMSPHQYLVMERLHIARRMLRNSKRSVLDVGMACGFGHASRFASTYARHFGELPSASQSTSRSNTPRGS